MTSAEAPRGRAFEWFVAWRHLRDPERRSRWLLVVGMVVMVLGLALALASLWFAKRVPTPETFFRSRTSLLAENLRMAGVGSLIGGSLLAYLGILQATFTVFTAISIFGVFLGTCLPIITLSVMSGFEVDLKTKIRGAKADVVVTVADDRPFTNWEDIRRTVSGVPGVVASTPYLEGEIMIRTGPAAAGIVLRGIDPTSAPSVLDLSRALRDGKIEDLVHPENVPEMATGRGEAFGDLDRVPPRPVKKSDEDGVKPRPPREVLPSIILGEELYAHTLRVFIGSEVEVVCPLCRMGPTGPMPGYGRFRVAGHFYSGMYEFDSKLAYVSLEEAQRFLRMPGEVTGLDLRTRRPEDARDVAAALAGLLGPRYDVRSWEELNKGLFMALRLEKIAMFVVLAFILLVASFSIISTLIMSVTQKAREVAILKSMGATEGAIRRVFFAEGLYIGLLGLTVGVASGVLACKLIDRYGLPLPTDVYYISKLPVVMRSGEILSVAGLALVLSCLATVYPAVLASRMRPVDGLRYE